MVRKARIEDLDALLAVYAAARQYMSRNGNPSQWGNGYPERALLEADIQSGWLYVFERDGTVHGAFAFIVGDDPTYAVIENGRWFDEAPYGTIHRLAGDGMEQGLFAQCLAFCREIIPNIRADTHHDNRTMQHILEKNGFVRCGMIHVADGSPRIAYQLSVLEN